MTLIREFNQDTTRINELEDKVIELASLLTQVLYVTHTASEEEEIKEMNIYAINRLKNMIKELEDRKC